jgi:hypothetical protein
VPHLRNVYKKLNVNFGNGDVSVGGFGLVHDGIDPDLFFFLSRDVFGDFADDTVRKRNLDAFVQCFDTGTAPAVGHTRFITSLNVTNVEVQAAWTLLENQVTADNINLIAKGTLEGRLHGLVYDSDAGLYRTDKTGLGPFTRLQLQAMIEEGDALSLMGVPPGSGIRMGVDRNDNEILDGDEPQPPLSIAMNGGNVKVAWSTNAAGFVLETSDQMATGQWQTETNQRNLIDGEQAVINPAETSTQRYYRLRGF